MNEMPYYLRVAWLAVSGLFRKSYVANVCGHRTKRTGNIMSLGESYIMSMPLSENGNPDYCLKCIGKMSIRCVWCGKPIHIGSPVTLYLLTESSSIPDHAVKHQDDPQSFVGCLRWDCADTGLARVGFWRPPGKVTRVPSPLGMLFEGNGEVMGIIVNNLNNPDDLLVITRVEP